jgi:hypothetical protein
MKRSKPFIEFHEDFEREHLKDFVYLQADREEEEQRIMQEIMEEENRLPANIEVIYEIKEKDESKTDTLPF